MAARYGLNILKTNLPFQTAFSTPHLKLLHTSPVFCEVQSGRVKITQKRDKAITYEQAGKPHHISVRKAWNSWNTSTIKGGVRPAETANEDFFIRKFVTGTFSGCVLSQIIIKRQHNIIRIAGIFNGSMSEERYCFLIGYTEELLSRWLHCIVKLEVQILLDPQKMIFTYI